MIGELEMSKAGATAKACLVAEKIQIALSEPYSLRVQHDGTLGEMIKHQCTASIGLNLILFILRQFEYLDRNGHSEGRLACGY